MKSAVIYIHGKGGSPGEAKHYIPLFPSCDVIGLDYSSGSPQEAEKEFPALFDKIYSEYGSVTVAANSIGAYFAMLSLDSRKIKRAFFISPIVDMEKLILDMMRDANITEDELMKKKQVEAPSGELISWEYLSYVRRHPVSWSSPLHILYGQNDALTSYSTVSAFARRVGATLTVMPLGEHWFHTEEQMNFLDGWIKRFSSI